MSKMLIDKFTSPGIVGDLTLGMYFSDSIPFVNNQSFFDWSGKLDDVGLNEAVNIINNFMKDSFWGVLPMYVAKETLFTPIKRIFPNTKILSRNSLPSKPIIQKSSGKSYDTDITLGGYQISTLTIGDYSPLEITTASSAGDPQMNFIVLRENYEKNGKLQFPSDRDFDYLSMRITLGVSYKKVEVYSLPVTVKRGSHSFKVFTSFNESVLPESENNPFLPPDGGTSGGGGSGGGGGGGQGGDFGPSGQGGGGGSFDNTTEPIPVPSVPPVSAVTSGFITLFNPSLSELRDLCSYMWSDLFDVATWKKLFADPMDAILGLSLLPVTVPNGGKSDVKVGNISTGVSMTKAASQYVVVDCGSIKIDECWGAYLDYEPYTKAEVYLPFIGTHQLAIDDIMSKTVQIVYNVDILTGACYCFIKCDGSVLYNFQGSCAIPIPVTSTNYASMIASQISIAGSIGSLIASSGAVAPAAVSNIASAAVNTLKPNIQKSGSLSGSGGLMGIRKPYLILTRPKQAVAKSQNAFMGYPSFITAQLNTISGWTQVESVNLSGIPCTEFELTEIEKLLKEGVIL